MVWPFPPLNVVYVVLICLAFTVAELLIGGTRLLFGLPAYGFVAVAGVLSLVDIRRPKMPANGWCLLSSTLFFGYILARSLTSPVLYLAWFDRFMVLAALAVYLLTACLLTDPRRRLWILAALLALGITNLVVGARQFAGGDGFMLFGFLRSIQYSGRASGLYICPYNLSFFFVVVGCLGLAAALWSRTRPWIKLLMGYLSVCCLGGIIITASRGGFLSVTAGLSVLTFLGCLRVRATSPGLLPRVILAIVIAVVVVAGGVGVAVRGSNLLQDRAKNLLDRKDIRTLLWPAAVQEFQTNPAVGTGSATYLYYGRKFRDPGVQLDPIRPHSDYLELLGEYGAAGVAGFLLFLVAHLWWGWRAFKHLSLRMGNDGGSNAAAWNIGCLSAVACMAVHSIFDFNLHIPVNTLLLAFVFGQLANPGRALTGGEQAARLRLVDLLPRLALPALSVWLLAEGGPKLPGEYFAEKARVALRDGRQLAAINFARQGLERQTNDPLLYYYMGEARLAIVEKREATGLSAAADPINQSYRRDALEAYRHALDLAPDDSTLLMRVGELLTRAGEFAEAGSIFDRLLTWDPNSGTAQTYYGFYLQRLGRLDEAEAAYRHALALNGMPAANMGLEQIIRERAAAGAEAK